MKWLGAIKGLVLDLLFENAIVHHKLSQTIGD
jgi:hypothetical protein